MARGYRFGVVGSLSLVPDGSTVTPTDDITIWLKCGRRSETYTTLSQVLADSTCLGALIADNNAVNYMVRSTTWASTVCADSGAMTLIGGNNYCANTLLGNSTWLNAICNSTYFENVLNAKVPTMTSNTTPSGVCSGSTADSGAEYYKAFDNNFNNTWSSTSADNNAYVQYEFASAITVNKLSMCPYITNRGNAVRQFVLSASNDGFVNDSHDLFTSPDYSNSTTAVFNFTINEAIQNSTAYKYYRVRVLSSYDTSNYKGIRELQFYGRQDV